MDKAEEKQDTQRVLRCDPKQLELLRKCSEKKDMTEWNKWREQNPYEEIWLQGANLQDAYLKGADLHHTHLEGAKLERANLQGADLILSNLKGARISNAELEQAWLLDAHLECAWLDGAHLWGVDLRFAHLERVWLPYADLRRANLSHSHLEGAHLWGAILERVNLYDAQLEGVRLEGASLEGANFTACSVDGSTLIWNCKIDLNTDFRSVGLENCRIDGPTKNLLQYNRRRMNWEDWYLGKSTKKWVRRRRQLLTSPVRLFWCMSEYGRSTVRILVVFFALAIVFALAYWGKPDCVMVNGQVGGLRNFLHALYFSVVTMTTLGFGDIAANPQSSCGQVLLMIQVFCGYFLLGAIVTRLSILFTAGGPAGRFSKKSTKKA